VIFSLYELQTDGGKDCFWRSLGYTTASIILSIGKITVKVITVDFVAFVAL